MTEAQKNRWKAERLSKSLFTTGLQCPKALWLTKNRPDLRTIKASQQAVLSSGTSVGELAQQLFPGGVEIPFDGLSVSEQLKMTQELMGSGTKVLYEASFRFDNIFIKADIMVKKGRYWHLYEVKSSTGVKDVYLKDLALQYYVLKSHGLPVSKAHLVHLDTGYVRGKRLNPKKLFAIADLTEEVRAKQSSLPQEIERLRKAIAQGEPARDIGPHCSEPYECFFAGHCWQHIPSPSVFSLRGRGKPDAFHYYSQGKVRLEDILRDELKWRQQIQLDGHLSNTSVFDREAVSDFLQNLTYPLSFLDFETTGMGMPVPLFEGTSSYQHVPFQFSLHVQKRREGKLHHHEFLAHADAAPQQAFLNSLLDSLPARGSIIAWNKAYEIRILRELAKRFPKSSGEIAQIVERFVDLAEPFSKMHIYEPGFWGSYSIKAVLPVLVPELSYKELEIGDGMAAAEGWMGLLDCRDEAQIASTRKALLQYCELDTYAMVRIFRHLQNCLSPSVSDG